MISSINIPGVIGEVNLVIDPLSAFFIAVISVMSLIALTYSFGYIKPYLGKKKNISSHYLFFGLLVASMILVTMVQNAIAFIIVWEIMSLSSFFLIIFEGEKPNVLSAGINYFVTMHISVLFLLTGFIILSFSSGSYDFTSFKGHITSIPFIILFIGFGIKAGFVPFHSWLPKAHPAAPSHISGLMSGVMIKTGIYGILRIITLIGIPQLRIAYFVLGISIISAIFGILYAIAQHDLKKLLAYSSIENIGIIGIGIGIGMLGLAYSNGLVAVLGFSGAIVHILNHSIFKQLLFFAAGAVYNKTHTKNIEKLGGLIKSMPVTSVLFLIGSVAISGLPPLNGFISEFLLYIGLLNGLSIKNPTVLIVFILAIAALALVGTMALLCFTQAFGITFLGVPRSKKAESVKEDVSKTMILPMGILAFMTFIIGLFPQYVMKLIAPVVSVLVNRPYMAETAGCTTFLRTISLSGLGLIILFLIIYGLRSLMLRNKQVIQHETWGCGYNRINNRMQYTASSYSELFLSVLKPFFSINYGDIFEFYLIKPLLKLNSNIIKQFYWIQSGNTQQYIMYGLIFLIFAIICAVGGL